MITLYASCVVKQVAAKGGGSDAATNKRKALEAALKLRVRLLDAEHHRGGGVP